MNKLIKIALAVSIVLAWAFTSCSDDKETWLSCKEAGALVERCQASAMQSGCQDEACFKVAAEKCVKDSGACNGLGLDECGQHYTKQCPGMFDGDDDGQ